jgi:hypothetical protein
MSTHVESPEPAMSWRLFVEDLFPPRLHNKQTPFCALGPTIQPARVVGELLRRVIAISEMSNQRIATGRMVIFRSERRVCVA